jgi:hypothetical protein
LRGRGLIPCQWQVGANGDTCNGSSDFYWSVEVQDTPQNRKKGLHYTKVRQPLCEIHAGCRRDYADLNSILDEPIPEKYRNGNLGGLPCDFRASDYAAADVLKVWTAGSLISIGTSDVDGGTLVSPSLSKTLANSSAARIMGYRYRYAGAITSDSSIMAYTKAGGSQIILLINPSGQLSIQVPFIATLGPDLTVALAQDTYYVIEFGALMSDTVGRVEVKVNGVQVPALTSIAPAERPRTLSTPAQFPAKLSTASLSLQPHPSRMRLTGSGPSTTRLYGVRLTGSAPSARSPVDPRPEPQETASTTRAPDGASARDRPPSRTF